MGSLVHLAETGSWPCQGDGARSLGRFGGRDNRLPGRELSDRGHIFGLLREREMMGSDCRTDAELLAATPKDPDAFALFYRRHVRNVIAFCTRRMAPGEVADVVSEVFATALVYRKRFDPARGPAGAWLNGIAANKIAQAQRRDRVEAKLYRRIGGQRLRLEPSELEITLGPAELLAGLPEDQRRAVVARVIADKPYVEIAQDERVSAQVVRKRVSRALSTLRSRLKEAQP